LDAFRDEVALGGERKVGQVQTQVADGGRRPKAKSEGASQQRRSRSLSQGLRKGNERRGKTLDIKQIPREVSQGTTGRERRNVYGKARQATKQIKLKRREEI
jgi:hypothetical protein